MYRWFFTNKNGKIAARTPAFRGVETFETFTQNARENSPMQQEQKAFAAMLGALDETEHKTRQARQVFYRDIHQGRGGQRFSRIMEKYKAELADTYIAFSGTPALDAINNYVRIDGASVWIELSMQRAASWHGIHPHSVWRDKSSDYGGN